MNPAVETNALDALLEREGAPPREPLARGAWLRRFLEPGAAARAAEQLELRERAAGRLPRPERLCLTRAGLEQATHGRVAAARAERIAQVAGPGARVLDATCGLGGEAAALAAAGLAVVAADRDAATAACAAHNLAVWGARVPVVRADALAPPLAPDRRGDWLLVADPSRRVGGRRSLDPQAWSPAWSALARELGHWRGSLVKLAPAARAEELGSALAPDRPSHWVWTSRGGGLVELVHLGGVLAGPEPGREAWILPGEAWIPPGEVGAPGARCPGARYLGPAERAPDAAPVPDPAAVAWIAAPDPALVASGLLGPVAAAAGHAPLGSGIAFTGGAAPADTVGLRDLRVLGTAKLDRKAVRRLLAEHGVGPLRVLARGLSESAEALEKRFAGPGTERGVAVVARCDSGRRLWLVEEGRDGSALQ